MRQCTTPPIVTKRTTLGQPSEAGAEAGAEGGAEAGAEAGAVVGPAHRDVIRARVTRRCLFQLGLGLGLGFRVRVRVRVTRRRLFHRGSGSADVAPGVPTIPGLVEIDGVREVTHSINRTPSHQHWSNYQGV